MQDELMAALREDIAAVQSTLSNFDRRPKPLTFVHGSDQAAVARRRAANKVARKQRKRR